MAANDDRPTPLVLCGQLPAFVPLAAPMFLDSSRVMISVGVFRSSFPPQLGNDPAWRDPHLDPECPEKYHGEIHPPLPTHLPGNRTGSGTLPRGMFYFQFQAVHLLNLKRWIFINTSVESPPKYLIQRLVDPGCNGTGIMAVLEGLLHGYT